jgi:predicted acylesterase/phospholipase RssA
MKALALSGGGSKGAFTAGAVKYLLTEEKMSFDLAVGTSTGSLVGGPALLGDGDYLRDVYTSVADPQIFNNSFAGAVLGRANLLDGPLDARLTPLHKLLKEYYLEGGKLRAILDSGKTLVVACVNVRTGGVHFVSSRDVAAERIQPITFVRAIVASCSEPVFTRPIQVYESEETSPYRKDLFYDGGVKEFAPIEHAVKLGADDVWAVATSPIRIEETPWGGKTDPGDVSLVDALAWTVDAFWAEVYRTNRFRAHVYVRWERARRELMARLRAEGLSEDRARQVLDLPPECRPADLALPSLRLLTPRTMLPTALEFDPAIMLKYLAEGEIVAEKFIADGAPLYTHDPSLDPWGDWA